MRATPDCVLRAQEDWGIRGLPCDELALDSTAEA
jgi:hypothetical protein